MPRVPADWANVCTVDAQLDNNRVFLYLAVSLSSSHAYIIKMCNLQITRGRYVYTKYSSTLISSRVVTFMQLTCIMPLFWCWWSWKLEILCGPNASFSNIRWSNIILSSNHLFCPLRIICARFQCSNQNRSQKPKSEKSILRRFRRFVCECWVSRILFAWLWGCEVRQSFIKMAYLWLFARCTIHKHTHMHTSQTNTSYTLKRVHILPMDLPCNAPFGQQQDHVHLPKKAVSKIPNARTQGTTRTPIGSETYIFTNTPVKCLFIIMRNKSMRHKHTQQHNGHCTDFMIPLLYASRHFMIDSGWLISVQTSRATWHERTRIKIAILNNVKWNSAMRLSLLGAHNNINNTFAQRGCCLFRCGSFTVGRAETVLLTKQAHTYNVYIVCGHGVV